VPDFTTEYSEISEDGKTRKWPQVLADLPSASIRDKPQPLFSFMFFVVTTPSPASSVAENLVHSSEFTNNPVASFG
jgi:hypothetical protein